MNLKNILCTLCACAPLLAPSILSAQEATPQLIKTLRLETRFDYDRHEFDDDRDATGGISGKFLNLVMAGDITDRFSYAYRQRILPNGGKKSFFDGTDWLNLTYKIDDHFSLNAGKQVFMVGGFEYDQAPIDVYYWSDFWNNVRCYQMGAMLSYTDKSKRNTLSFQLANSNYTDDATSNLYAYNLIWYGNFGQWQTIYSVNMVERSKGSYINYIALGNKFTFDGFSFFVDFMNRASDKQKNFLFDDFTLIGQLDWQPSRQWNLFAKGGYDTNKVPVGRDNGDIFVKPGVEYHYYGAGAEFFPLKDRKDIRVHGFVALKDAGEEELHFNVGLTWRLDVLAGLKTLFNKK